MGLWNVSHCESRGEHYWHALGMTFSCCHNHKSSHARVYFCSIFALNCPRFACNICRTWVCCLAFRLSPNDFKNLYCQHNANSLTVPYWLDQAETSLNGKLWSLLQLASSSKGDVGTYQDLIVHILLLCLWSFCVHFFLRSKGYLISAEVVGGV